ncbi:MAG TPA: hypothetical protein VGW33_03840 [Terriglobia bacterium]|nr:hypothetical protein [Terriglobia bacterium]
MTLDDKANCEWLGIDIHIHTPASSDYKGNREDGEYLNLLSQANEFTAKEPDRKSRKSGLPKRPLGCIAFTDHNSVEGFRKYRQLHQETLALRNNLRARDPGNAFIEQLEKDLKIWESVRVLMGVEIKADPGIDLLVIFHESVEPDTAVAFLESAYGKPYGHFAGDPTPLTTRTVLDTLNLVSEHFREKALVVAPHVDSSAGIYDALKDYGQARCNALRHPSLKALSFNKPETRDRVRNLFGQPDYRRPDNIALIQSSDFHGQLGAAIGQPRTEVCVAKGRPTFTSLKDAFAHPERVRCSIDFVQREYELLTADKRVTKFEPAADAALFRPEDFSRVAEAACGMVNTEGGIIELEVRVDPNAERDSYMKPLLAQLADDILPSIEPKPTRFSTRNLRFSPGKARVLVFFPQSSQLRTIDGAVVLLKGAQNRRASAAEIEHLVARNMQKRFGARFERTLEDVSGRSTLLSKLPQGIPLVLGCQKKLHFGLPSGVEILDPQQTASSDQEAQDEIEELRRKVVANTPFGDPRGNTSLILHPDPPRQPDQYLRFAAFRCNLDPAAAERWGCGKVDAPTLAVIAGGNVQLLEPGYLVSMAPVVLLRLSGDWEGRSYELLSWFKSSFFIWHCAVHIGDPDAFFQLQLRPSKFAFPRLSCADMLQRLATFARNMLLDENKFMDEVNRLKRKDVLTSDVQEKERIKFNKTADRRCLDLDKEIFSFLELAKAERQLIARTLREIHMTDFGFLAETDEPAD